MLGGVLFPTEPLEIKCHCLSTVDITIKELLQLDGIVGRYDKDEYKDTRVFFIGEECEIVKEEPT